MTNNELFYKNKNLVLFLIKRIDYPHELYDDLIQSGYLGLWKAINNYNKDYNVTLSAYATKYIMGNFFNEINLFYKKNKEIDFNFNFSILSETNNQEFENLIYNLNKEEKTIVKLKFILNYDFKKIAEALNKEESYIKRKYQRIKNKLKNELL